MKRSDIERLVEASRRRVVTPREQAEFEAWLSAHPEARADWAEEAALSRGLQALPEAPLSPQFTRRVLEAVERSDSAASRFANGRRLPAWGSLLLGWRGASVAVVLLTLALGLSLERRAEARARLAASVAALSDLTEWPDLAALADFEVVYYLPTGQWPNEAELARAFE